jgi:exopolyphosphatase/guanosine-5'-triphosphate,3'-diphosphate pyrophosphatase
MLERAIATIDIGTNTTLLLVARPRLGAPLAAPEVLAERAEITRLGRGIGGDGRLGSEGIERTLAVLARYAAVAAEHRASIWAIGTEALRRAPNADEFLRPANIILGGAIEVVDGDREAALTFRAVAESFPTEITVGRVGVVDIGGGSTEIVVADEGKVVFRRSLPVGSVRLHERHVRGDPPTPEEAEAIERDAEAILDGAAEAFSTASLTMLVGVAGTVTSLAAMTLRLDSYDSERVHGSTLTLAELDARIADLAAMKQAERERIPGLDPRRADVIFAGALLLRAIVRRAGAPAIRVSDRGIRWGLYYERAARGDGAGLPHRVGDDSFRM